LNRMEVFADALSYMAGYGLKAYLITQDIRQIVDAYGNNESIVSNCHVRIAFAPNQFETAELLSKMTGTTTVQKASYNFSGSRLSPVMGHVNASVDHIERPLMTPDEVLRLKPPQKRGAGAEERIVAPGQMLIFVSGHRPILGTQMLYFLDSVLNTRAVLPPPSKFFTLEDGKPVPQHALNRTRNIVSKPEVVTAPEYEPDVEQRLIEQIHVEQGAK
jgi:type IV secretion system protein VirD4